MTLPWSQCSGLAVDIQQLTDLNLTLRICAPFVDPLKIHRLGRQEQPTINVGRVRLQCTSDQSVQSFMCDTWEEDHPHALDPSPLSTGTTTMSVMSPACSCKVWEVASVYYLVHYHTIFERL